ncbi:ALK and LTK ligand 1 [Monodelphis domestica]|uniref:ALK and LTK ligand 1 n=1 Tax=Monodelphis domestica TaxID=13616 RepID=F6QBB7_MONDO|nr:ALK and LTK ligand 1 [Monodelphis domestica]
MPAVSERPKLPTLILLILALASQKSQGSPRGRREARAQGYKEENLLHLLQAPGVSSSAQVPQQLSAGRVRSSSLLERIVYGATSSSLFSAVEPQMDSDRVLSSSSSAAAAAAAAAASSASPASSASSASSAAAASSSFSSSSSSTEPVASGSWLLSAPRSAEILPRDLNLKEKFIKHFTGPVTFSAECSKHFYRLYHNTRDCAVPAYYKRCARLLTRLAVSPLCTQP